MPLAQDDFFELGDGQAVADREVEVGAGDVAAVFGANLEDRGAAIGAGAEFGAAVLPGAVGGAVGVAELVAGARGVGGHPGGEEVVDVALSRVASGTVGSGPGVLGVEVVGGTVVGGRYSGCQAAGVGAVDVAVRLGVDAGDGGVHEVASAGVVVEGVVFDEVVEAGDQDLIRGVFQMGVADLVEREIGGAAPAVAGVGIGLIGVRFFSVRF